MYRETRSRLSLSFRLVSATATPPVARRCGEFYRLRRRGGFGGKPRTCLTGSTGSLHSPESILDSQPQARAGTTDRKDGVAMPVQKSCCQCHGSSGRARGDQKTWGQTKTRVMAYRNWLQLILGH